MCVCALLAAVIVKKKGKKNKLASHNGFPQGMSNQPRGSVVILTMMSFVIMAWHVLLYKLSRVIEAPLTLYHTIKSHSF